MLQFFLALALVVAMLFGYVAVLQLVVRFDSPLWTTRRRLEQRVLVRRATADLDREYASLVDEYRHIP